MQISKAQQEAQIQEAATRNPSEALDRIEASLRAKYYATSKFVSAQTGEMLETEPMPRKHEAKQAVMAIATLKADGFDAESAKEQCRRLQVAIMHLDERNAYHMDLLTVAIRIQGLSK